MAEEEAIAVVLEGLRFPTAVIDAAGDVVQANRRWSTVPGLTPGCRSLLELASELLTVSERLEFQQWLNDSRPAGPFVAEYSQPGSARAHWRALHVERLDGEEGRSLATVQDVALRRRVTADLHRSRTQLRAVVTGAPIWLFSLDLEGRFTLAEGLGAEVFGAGTDLVGHSISESFSHVPGIISAVMAAQRGETTTEKVHVGRMVFLVRCAPAYAPDGEAEGVVGVATDVTEQTRLERLKDELISIVSHELRTPLTAIHGALRLIEGGMSGPISDDALELVAVAGRNTRRLIRLVNDMLDLDKIEAGHLELRLEEVSLAELVDRAVEEIGVMASEAGVEISIEADWALRAHADADRVVQVVLNLLSNAIKHSPPGSRVEVRAEPSALGGTRVEVRDQGPGIPDAQQLRIFGRFEQLGEPTSRPPGTGLGLAISKALVEAHGGDIGVKSRLGDGACFHFRLPAGRRRELHEEAPVRADSARSLELRSSLVPAPAREDVGPLLAELESLASGGPTQVDAAGLLDLHARCRIAAVVGKADSAMSSALEEVAASLEELGRRGGEASDVWAKYLSEFEKVRAIAGIRGS
jgi:signal transduction histidine kinase